MTGIPLAARGRQVVRLLAEAIIGRGRDAGCACLHLDTLPAMRSGRALHASLALVTVEPYHHNPVAGSVCMEPRP